MPVKYLRFGKEFSIALNNKRSQAASMVIPPNHSEGGPDNQHKGCDQWLYVVSGRGMAIVVKKKLQIREGSLLFIERGKTHEIRNTGHSPLKTLNLYVPPAYSKSGNPLPAGKPGE